MSTKKVVIVAPAHIPLTQEWIDAVDSQSVDVIIVDDSNGKVSYPSEWDVYDYERQKGELGEEHYKVFEMFHKSSACRNFGHWLAYKKGYDVVIGLDSDCVVPENFVRRHLEGLSLWAHSWTNPIAKTGWFPRGYPYLQRQLPVVVNMGLWTHELDLSGKDRLENPLPLPSQPLCGEHSISTGMITLSGMNFAMNRDVVPGFLFLPNFEYNEDTFRRHDDIWGGYLLQKFMGKRNEYLAYGTPLVYHDTVVVPEEDAALELAGDKHEKHFYFLMDSIMSKVNPESYENMFKQFAEHSELLRYTQFERLIPAIQLWGKIF